MVSGEEMAQSKRVVVSHNVDRALKEGRFVCLFSRKYCVQRCTQDLEKLNTCNILLMC